MSPSRSAALMSGRNGPALLALAVLTGVFMLSLQSLTPPAPLGADAPASVFSAARAEAVLRFLLDDESPHPVGSKANQLVRDRLLQTLREMDLPVAVQRTTGCSTRRPICANVENVIATLPGETADSIVLMAHYDSVPHAPGAADDGAGVAAVIEAARVLQLQPPGRNRILLLFTDAEEVGLLGAEAFFSQHPLAADVKAVINLEGSGSGGPSLLLRTTTDGGHLLKTFQQYSVYPAATSMAQEVFERMPNDTDFSVSKRAGIPGIDFAFAFEFNHYHTPLDTIRNLDKGSLQHHGENLLPLVQGMRNADLSDTESNYVYLTLGKTVWITWPSAWSIPLALIAMLLLVVSGYRLRHRVPIGQTIGSAALAALALMLGLLACAGALWLCNQLTGTTVKFPASFWPSRLIMYGAAAVPVCLLGAWLRRRLDFWPLFLGTWWLLSLLALLLAIVAPLASNLLLLPAMAAATAAFLIVITGAADRTGLQLVLAIGAISVLGMTMMMLSYANEQTQGLTLAPAIYAGLAILAIALLPLRPGPAFTLAGLAAVLTGLIWSTNAPLYSQWRPQHVSLHYILDLDERSANWAALSANPLPQSLLAELDGQQTQAASLPWSSTETTNAPAPFINMPAPEVHVQRSGNRVELTIRSRTVGDFIGMAIPLSADISNLQVARQTVPVRTRGDFLQLGLFAAGQAKLNVSFDVAGPDPVLAYVFDIGNQLPIFASELTAARGSLAVPQHRGDQRIVFRRVKF